MKINKDGLSIYSYIWDLYVDPNLGLSEITRKDLQKIDDNGETVVVYLKEFALIYRNNGQVPYPEELLAPLGDEFFEEDGSWDDEAVENYLNQFASLIEIVRIV